jgi:TRAP-type C4-dicarboxylate transport system permease small subunit
MKNAIDRILNRAEGVLLLGSCASILIIMFLTTFDVLARKFFDYAIPSLYELTEDYFMVALVFLSISWVYRKGGHVRVTILEKYLPEGLKGPLEKFLKIPYLVLFLLITLKGWEVTVRAFEFGEVSSSVIAYPLAPAFCMVPLGCAFLCGRILQSFFLAREYEEGHGPEG